MTDRQNNSQKMRWTEKGGHPPEDDLRLYVDGELEAQAGALVKAHLEACWSCRVRLDEVQETIADFIGYRNQVLRRLVPSPPNNWRGFDSQLNQFPGSAGSRSWWAQLVSRLGRPFADLRSLAGSPLMIRFAVALLVTLTVTAAWIVFNREPVVTATELLERATEAQTQKILSASQPVVHQQIQVRRKRGSLSQTARLETWHDLNNSRFRQSSGVAPKPAANTQSQTQAKSGTTSEEMLMTLERVFQANRLDWRRPLSAVSFAEWRKSLRSKNEEIHRARLADGLEVLSLKTVSTEPPRPGAVLEATLMVRARDWHPFKQVLRVREETGETEYELVETVFEVVSLAAINSAIFAESPAAPLAAATPLAAPSPVPRSLSAIAPAPVTASVSLEIETLALLAQAGADLGEQVSVERTPNGSLKIQGIVETDQRKREILGALTSISHNPAVQIEINTVAEAVARQQQQTPAATGQTPPVIVQRVAPTDDSLPVENELRKYFSRDKSRAEEEARRFADRMVETSRRAMSHAGALKRLINQFSPEDLRTLTPEARAKWIGLIQSHARAFERETANLRQELQPIFFPAPPSGEVVDVSEISDDAGLARAVEQLFDRGLANEQVIRSAFTVSTQKSRTLQIGTPQFWQSLKRAEKLAAKIAVGSKQ